MIPYLYDYANNMEATINPSGIKTNTGMVAYFKRYLLQELISNYKCRIPDDWNKDFFMYVLFCLGYIVVFDNPKYGKIPMNCTLTGYGLFYEPTDAIISNPALPGIKKLKIGEDCEIIKMQPDYGSCLDIINLYATLMAVAVESISTNIFNSRLAYVFACRNDKQATSFKKMYDEISQGKPSVFVDKDLFDDEGKPQWQGFSNKLSENYIADKMLNDLASIENRFYTTIGINNANVNKKERLITDEVNANNDQTKALARLWLDTMRSGMEKVNNRYGLNLSIDLINNDKEVGGYVLQQPRELY